MCRTIAEQLVKVRENKKINLHHSFVLRLFPSQSDFLKHFFSPHSLSLWLFPLVKMGHLSFCQENAWVSITSASVCLKVCVCVFKVFYDLGMVPSPGKVMQGPFSGSH